MSAPFTSVVGSNGSWGTEYFLISASTSAVYQTTKCKLRIVIDLVNLIAGDEVRLRVYDKVNGGTATPIFEAYRGGTQGKLWTPTVEFWVEEGWEVSLKRTLGSDRTIKWSIKKDLGDTNVVSMDASTIDAATFTTAAKDMHQYLRRNTAQGGSASTITLDASASAVNDFYKNALCVIVSGTGIGEFGTIDSYVGATKIATMSANWATTTDNTSVFELFASGGGGGVSAATIAAAVLAAAAISPISADVQTWKGDVPNDLYSTGNLPTATRWQS